MIEGAKLDMCSTTENQFDWKYFEWSQETFD